MKRVARRVVSVSAAEALVLALTTGTTLAQNTDGASISGTDEAETLTGTAGSDALSGTGGDNLIFDDPKDSSTGGLGTNFAQVEKSANDRLEGDAGSDALVASDGDDALSGSEGDDALFGEGGSDDIQGGSGNDFLHSADDAASDTVSGGPGDDTCVVDANDSVSGCEVIRGSDMHPGKPWLTSPPPGPE